MILLVTTTAAFAVVLLLALLLWEVRRSAERAPLAVGRLESKVETLTQQLGQRMGDAAASAGQLNSMVHAQLATAQDTLHTVTERLARLDEATRQVERVGNSIAGLEQLLAAPKLRGNFGEWTLELLLAEVLPAEQVARQYRLPSRGVIVDAVVRMADQRLLPIDSKFPMDAYRRLADAQSRGDADAERSARADFIRSARARIDEIAGKYISPDDGTTELAMMYVAAESVYYEIVVRAHDLELVEYARERKVVLCSPNTLYAYLQALSAGLRGLQVAGRIREIQATLEHLRQDVIDAQSCFDRAATQLRHAAGNLDGARSALNRIEDRVLRAAEPDVEPLHIEARRSAP